MRNAAKLIKLSLDAGTAAARARATGVSPEVLAELAVALNLGAALTKEETDVLNRFETALNLILDRAYQRADQRYRNAARSLAGAFSVLIAIVAGTVWSSNSVHIAQFQGANPTFWNTGNLWLAILIGLVALPVAPIIKDLTGAGSSIARKMAER